MPCLRFFPFVLSCVVACSASPDSTNVTANGGSNDSDGGASNGGTQGVNNGGGTGANGANGQTGGGGTLDDDTCAADTFIAKLEPSALMFELDTSGSMNCALTEPGCLSDDPSAAPDDSRWDVFRTTLNGVLDRLPDSLAAGLMHFPNPDNGCAPTTPLVSIGSLSSTRAMIRSELAGLVPEYITPTHDAVLAALAQVRARSEKGRYVVLATDGAATVCEGCDASCANAGKVPSSESDALVANVKAAFDGEGIRTFVIGVPGSQNYRDVLSRLAQAGGTSLGKGCTDNGPNYCHYDLTDATVDFGALLEAVLGEIGGSVLACEFDVPTMTSFDEDRVNVQLTSGATKTELKRDKAEQNGWNYTKDQKRIRLFGPACDTAKQVQNGKIDILYGCPTVEVI